MFSLLLLSACLNAPSPVANLGLDTGAGLPGANVGAEPTALTRAGGALAGRGAADGGGADAVVEPGPPSAPWSYVDLTGAIDWSSLRILGRDLAFQTTGYGLLSEPLAAGERLAAALACGPAAHVNLAFQGGRLASVVTVPEVPCVSDRAARLSWGDVPVVGGRLGDADHAILVLDVPALSAAATPVQATPVPAGAADGKARAPSAAPKAAASARALPSSRRTPVVTARVDEDDPEAAEDDDEIAEDEEDDRESGSARPSAETMGPGGTDRRPVPQVWRTETRVGPVRPMGR